MFFNISNLNRIAICVILSVFMFQGQAIKAQPTSDYFEINKQLEIFIDAYKQVDQLYVENTTPGSVITEAIQAMLRNLDPYTVYYPESKIEDAFYLQTGKYGGIGSRISLVNNENTVLEVFKGFPADKAGLKAGDIITHIGNKSIQGVDLDNLEDGITGAPGSQLTITVKKLGKDTPEQITLTRESIKNPDVPLSKIIGSYTGYIKLDGFTQTASNEVATAFRKLKGAGATQLILDLRGNGGGLLMEAVNIVNFFVPKGTVITKTRGKANEWEQVYTASNEPLDTQIPIVVLIDEGSASASEVVSGALQDLDRAVIIGNNSFGKGLVQQTLDLSYNSKMKITVAKYYTPSGRCIQKLDYGNKQNGKAQLTEEHNESLFKTKNGRVVKDGRGIQPDIELTASDKQLLLKSLDKNYAYFNYGVNYRLKHETIDSMNFVLSDAEYLEFAKLTSENGEKIFPEWFEGYKKLTEDLTAISTQEVSNSLTQLKESLSSAILNTLLIDKKSILPELEKKIVQMYFHEVRALEYSLDRDFFIQKSSEVLSSSQYSTILSSVATDKNK
jgi:carboxyl-terminal processing protease